MPVDGPCYLRHKPRLIEGWKPLFNHPGVEGRDDSWIPSMGWGFWPLACLRRFSGTRSIWVEGEASVLATGRESGSKGQSLGNLQTSRKLLVNWALKSDIFIFTHCKVPNVFFNIYALRGVIRVSKIETLKSRSDVTFLSIVKEAANRLCSVIWTA